MNWMHELRNGLTPVRKIIVSKQVRDKIDELESYLKDELQLSKEAARKRSSRMRQFVLSLSGNVDYPLCRFKRWCALGYRCAIFEKDWVFAYEILEEGIIIRDMSNTALLQE